MKHRLLKKLLPLGLIAILAFGFSSCGTMRTHWGMEHEYNYDFDNGRPGGHHKPPKPPKKKKHKKHKKHHNKHHDCCWDD